MQEISFSMTIEKNQSEDQERLKILSRVANLKLFFSKVDNLLFFKCHYLERRSLVLVDELSLMFKMSEQCNIWNQKIRRSGPILR